MSGLNAENFESYGSDINLSLNGIWAQIGSAFGVGQSDTVLQIPAWETKGRYWLAMLARGSGMRRVLPAGLTSVGFARDLYLLALPPENNSTYIVQMRDGANAALATVKVTTDGNITLHNAAGTQIASTAGPVIKAATDHKIQLELVMHATLGTITLKVDGVDAIVASNLVMAGTITQYFIGLNDSSFPATIQQYCKWVVAYSLTGTYNSSFPAITGVTTLYPGADTVTAGFTPRPRQNVGAGVLYVPNSGSLLDCGSAAGYALGTGDYTIETNVRFNAPVAANDFADLFGDWIAATNLRSYRLVKYGANTLAGHLRFEVTTDGTLGTLVAVQDIVWNPQVGRWYNIAVVRSAGQNYLFIDGVLVNPPVADANNYFIGTSFAVGGEKSGATTVLAASSINGMFDQTRLTKGVARYTANYTPTTAPFPTSFPADPSFASVQLLLLYDTGLTDASSFAQTITARGAAAQNVPADAPPAYLTVNPAAPLDDRYLEAALVAATNVLTCTAAPLNTQQVTLGATTYTFNTALGGANSVLIGVSLATALANFINTVNAGPGSGVVYGGGTVANASVVASAGPASNQVTVTAITAGTAGNAIASTETLTAGSFIGATLAGGANIPGPSAFTLTPLDPTVTGVRWIEARKRSFVDAGAASLKLDFLVNASVAAGAAQALTTTPTYYLDTFEQDPQTAGALTPTSIVNGSVRLTRTA